MRVSDIVKGLADIVLLLLKLAACLCILLADRPGLVAQPGIGSRSRQTGTDSRDPASLA